MKRRVARCLWENVARRAATVGQSRAALARRALSSSPSPAAGLPMVKVHVIAHRGASGRMPDHTLETYQAAFETGADWIELDAHSTLDGHLVVNHDIELGETTDIEDWEWAAARRTRTLAPCNDGESDVMEGWMVSDFTLEELKRLRVRMRHASRSQEFNLLYQIPTVTETCERIQSLVDGIKASSTRTWTKEAWLEARNDYVVAHGKARGNLNVGLYIETKRPAWYRSLGEFSPPSVVSLCALSTLPRFNPLPLQTLQIPPPKKTHRDTHRASSTGTHAGLPLEEKLVATIEESSFDGPIIIQSFEEDSLRRIRALKPEWDTVMLLTQEAVDGRVADGTWGAYLDTLAESGCSGIGPSKVSIIPDPTSPPTSSVVVDEAHKRNLFVHPYTFKSDVLHLDQVYGGNALFEFSRFFDLGVDGVFADFPGHGVFAREVYNRARKQGHELSFQFDR